MKHRHAAKLGVVEFTLKCSTHSYATGVRDPRNETVAGSHLGLIFASRFFKGGRSKFPFFLQSVQFGTAAAM
jgi:hypothetical protein